jgi:ketosteroid isomerase-like protein
MDQLVRDFFERYERANAYSDVVAMGNLYADTFMFGGSKGVQAVKKQDFLKIVPKMKAHFASLGLSETQLQTVEARAIDAKYLLVKAAWKMTVRHLPGHRTQVDAFATYILEQRDEGTLSIVFHIDHQDLAALIGSQQAIELSSITG